MLRTLLLLIVLVILIGIALVATGVVNLRQDGNGVSLETKDLEVGTTVTNVQVPVVRMENRQVEVPTVQVQQGNEANAQ
jgi:hypothetical protein